MRLVLDTDVLAAARASLEDVSAVLGTFSRRRSKAASSDGAMYGPIQPLCLSRAGPRHDASGTSSLIRTPKRR